MTSHTYDFERADGLRVIAWPLVPVACFALLMHLAAALGILPRSRPTPDVDHVILLHQVEAARNREEAQVILVGDSSCLMDVSARQLTETLGGRVLNLSAHSYLDLTAYAALLRAYTAAHANPPRAVVVALHPEALRRPAPEAFHMRLLDTLLDDHAPPQDLAFRDRLLRVLGLELFRDRAFCRVVPTALPGPYGRVYGFSTDLDRYMTQAGGSAVDPDRRPFQGNAEYRLAPPLEETSASLRAAVPRTAKLLAAITPVPAGFAGRDYASQQPAMLAERGRWLRADATLTELPATLPDDLFASTTHLTEAGMRQYTGMLGQALKQRLK
jgi:hypothetical protein